MTEQTVNSFNKSLINNNNDSDSDSNDESPSLNSQAYIDRKKYIFSEKFQKRPEKTIIKPDSESSLLLPKRIKNESGMKNPSILRRIFSCWCIQ